MVKTKVKAKIKPNKKSSVAKKSVKTPVQSKSSITKPPFKNNSHENGFNFIIITSFIAIIALTMIGFVKTSYEVNALTGLATYTQESFQVYECTPGDSCSDPILTYNTACVGKDVYYLNIQKYCSKQGQCTIEKQYLDVTRFLGTCPTGCVDGFCV